MFLSKTDARAEAQELQAYDPATVESDFGEVFAASVGQVFDEELSISSSLNNDMYRDREDAASAMVDDGFDLTPYTDHTGVIDYDRLSNETDFGIKTDRELYDERNSLLEQRRNYANDVKERGNGTAQFLGSMTGYMLDPVNVIAMPLGASAASLRGLSTLAQIGRVAKVEGAIGIAAETAIQPFIFSHKNEIGSPYEVSDALMAIGTAAAGGAVLGGSVAGVSGFLRNVLNLPLPDSPTAQGAIKDLNRMIENIEANPARAVQSEALGTSARKFFQMDNDELTQQIILMKREVDPSDDITIALEAAEAVLDSRKGRWGTTLEAERQDAIGQEIETLRVEEETRLPRGERKALKKSLQELQTQRNAIVEAEPVVKKSKGVSARKAVADAKAKVKAEADGKRAELTVKIDEIQSRLDVSRAGQDARAGLSRVEQGIFPKRLQQAISEINHQRMVKVDIDYLRQLEATRKAQNTIEPRVEPEPIRTAEPSRKLDEIDPYEEAEMARYKALGTDSIVVKDGGEVLNAKAFIDEQTELMDALTTAKACQIG